MLLAATFARAGADQAAVLRRLVGDPDLDDAGAGEVLAVMRATGALAMTEGLIERRWRRAMRASTPPPSTRPSGRSSPPWPPGPVRRSSYGQQLWYCPLMPASERAIPGTLIATCRERVESGPGAGRERAGCPAGGILSSN